MEKDSYPSGFNQALLTLPLALFVLSKAPIFRGIWTLQIFIITQPWDATVNISHNCCYHCLGLSESEFGICNGIASWFSVPIIFLIGAIIDRFGLPTGVIGLALVSLTSGLLIAFAVWLRYHHYVVLFLVTVARNAADITGFIPFKITAALTSHALLLLSNILLILPHHPNGLASIALLCVSVPLVKICLLTMLNDYVPSTSLGIANALINAYSMFSTGILSIIVDKILNQKPVLSSAHIAVYFLMTVLAIPFINVLFVAWRRRINSCVNQGTEKEEEKSTLVEHWIKQQPNYAYCTLMATTCVFMGRTLISRLK